MSRSSQNITYSWIPDVVHDELDFVLVLGRPGGRDVDHPGEELRTVRYHVEIQLPSEEEELVTLSVWDNSHLVKMAADLSITSACLNCLLRSLAMGAPWVPVPPHRMRMNFIPPFSVDCSKLFPVVLALVLGTVWLSLLIQISVKRILQHRCLLLGVNGSSVENMSCGL